MANCIRIAARHFLRSYMRPFLGRVCFYVFYTRCRDTNCIAKIFVSIFRYNSNKMPFIDRDFLHTLGIRARDRSLRFDRPRSWFVFRIPAPFLSGKWGREW